MCEVNMATPRILQDIETLPPEAQKQVSDFVAFLKVRYGVSPRKKTKHGKLKDEPEVEVVIELLNVDPLVA